MEMKSSDLLGRGCVSGYAVFFNPFQTEFDFILILVCKNASSSKGVKSERRPGFPQGCVFEKGV